METDSHGSNPGIVIKNPDVPLSKRNRELERVPGVPVVVSNLSCNLALSLSYCFWSSSYCFPSFPECNISLTFRNVVRANVTGKIGEIFIELLMLQS